MIYLTKATLQEIAQELVTRSIADKEFCYIFAHKHGKTKIGSCFAGKPSEIRGLAQVVLNNSACGTSLGQNN